MKHPTVGQIADWINEIAPFESAESFDNVGLLIGDRTAGVTKVFFTLDLTEEVALAAARQQAELIITHHPFIFSPIRRIDYTTPQGRILRLVLENGVSVIAAHTNWDKAPGGVGDTLAGLLGLEDVTSLDDYVRIGSLPAPVTAEAYQQQIDHSLHFLPHCYGACDTICRVAVAGGSYGEGYALALKAGADAFVVGEIKHHEILDATAQGLVIYDAGHHATELPAMPALHERFKCACQQNGWSIQTCLFTAPPFAGATHM